MELLKQFRVCNRQDTGARERKHRFVLRQWRERDCTSRQLPKLPPAKEKKKRKREKEIEHAPTPLPADELRRSRRPILGLSVMPLEPSSHVVKAAFSSANWASSRSRSRSISIYLFCAFLCGEGVGYDYLRLGSRREECGRKGRRKYVTQRYRAESRIRVRPVAFSSFWGGALHACGSALACYDGRPRRERKENTRQDNPGRKEKKKEEQSRAEYRGSPMEAGIDNCPAS